MCRLKKVVGAGTPVIVDALRGHGLDFETCALTAKRMYDKYSRDVRSDHNPFSTIAPMHVSEQLLRRFKTTCAIKPTVCYYEGSEVKQLCAVSSAEFLQGQILGFLVGPYLEMRVDEQGAWYPEDIPPGFAEYATQIIEYDRMQGIDAIVVSCIQACGVTALIHHSADANVAYEPVTVGVKMVILVRAKKHIKPGDELLVDRGGVFGAKRKQLMRDEEITHEDLYKRVPTMIDH